ncbi:FapA family protein [bacterium]|nr:FapA family protein [bacterium]
MSEEDDKFIDLQNLLAEAGLIDHSDKLDVDSSVFEELDESPLSQVKKKNHKKNGPTITKTVFQDQEYIDIDDDEDPEVYEQQINHGEGLEKAKVELSFSEDLMEAYLFVEPDEKYPLDRRFLKRFFLFRGLRYGIDWEAVDAIIETSKQNLEVHQEIVASGKTVQLGRQAQILKYFEEAKTFKFSEASDEEKTNYYRMHRINMVSKGLLLAEKLTAIPGVDGINTKGEVIPSLNSKDIIFKAGKGCLQKGSQIYSEIDGRPSIDDTGRIEVVPLYTIYGDVDLSVGDLKFNGNIEIMGNVLAGFTIEAGGSIFVKGSVECSNLTAQEDITINGSLTCTAEKGLIHAK